MKEFYNLAFLAQTHNLLKKLNPDAAQAEMEIVGHLPGGIRRLGVLSGSFNPLTRAHLLLAEAALGTVERVLFGMSVRTVDKEHASGMTLEDRALLFHLLQLPLGLMNRGLYYEQAEAIHRHLPGVRLYFIVGHDKIIQIFDPRYYEERDLALARLFALSHFLVAPRSGKDRDVLAQLLNKAENRRFAGYVTGLDVPDEIMHDSSTGVRDAVAAGGSLPEIVPDVVGRFIEETGCYAASLRLADGTMLDRYAIRSEVLLALSRLGLVDAPFETLVAIACGPEGAGLRAALTVKDDRWLYDYVMRISAEGERAGD